MTVNGKAVPCERLCLRAPEYFDLLLPACHDKKSFGKSILNKFVRMLPEGDVKEAKKRLTSFFEEVDKTAQPVCQAQLIAERLMIADECSSC